MMIFKKLINGLLIVIVVSSCTKIKPKDYFLEGNVFGASFHITYLSDNDSNLEHQVDSLFRKVNKSLSTYDVTSDISRINNGDTTVVVDAYFLEVYEKANRIYQETDGVFDPTIGVLVNAWGFGPQKGLNNLEANEVNELIELVGYDKIKIDQNRIVKKYPKMYLDYNAIAKGYGVDVIARFLELKGIDNYMVEIGGEVRVRGKNFNGNYWRIGIEKPNSDGSRTLQHVVQLIDESIATSGNYRKFRIDSVTGEKYVHTIDTKTGYTSKGDLLSASVIGSLDCADVDGYATAFMAMGLQPTKEFVSKYKDLKVFLIYIDEEGELKEYSNF